MSEVFIQSVEGIDLDYVWNELSDIRKAKIKRLKNKKQALLSAAAELALNKAVRKWFPDSHIPVNYAYTKTGKPYLTELDAYISLSHSGELAVCAISENEIGVDIQNIDQMDIKIAKRFFSNEENDYIYNSVDSNKAFFEIWVKKEARVKLTGEGIGGGFAASREDKPNEYDYNMISLPFENYLICICERKMYKNS